MVMMGLIVFVWSFYDFGIVLGIWVLFVMVKLVVLWLLLFVNLEVIFVSIVVWFLGKDSVIE